MSLGSKHPTPYDWRLRHVLCKSLLGRERHQGFGPLVRGLLLPARLMQHGGKVQGHCQTGGVRQGLGQGERLSQALQGLIRIAEDPEGQGRMAEATHAGVMPAVEPCVRVVLLGIVERSPLLEVGSGSGKLAAQHQGRPQRVVGFQEERRVVDLLG